MSTEKTLLIRADEAKKTAKYFIYGNILAILIPFPIFVLWFGISIMVYAMFRHFPNPRVGYYTQMAAYHYYGLAGLLVPVLTFAPGSFFVDYWWLLWGVCALILLPLSIRELYKINRENWQDIEVKK